MDQRPITDDITRQRRLDAQDYANEVAGLEAGRQSRFLSEGRRDGDPRRQRDRQAFQDRLAELMADPVYRAHYTRVMDRLSEAERAADAALARLSAEIETAEQGLADMEDRAARLPDGTMVFRDAQGIVRTADGTPVDPVLAETIIWTGLEPSYEPIGRKKTRSTTCTASARRWMIIATIRWGMPVTGWRTGTTRQRLMS